MKKAREELSLALALEKGRREELERWRHEAEERRRQDEEKRRQEADERATTFSQAIRVSGESLLECPKCRYSEITDCPSAEVARLHCKNEGCGSVTCYVCKLEIGR